MGVEPRGAADRAVAHCRTSRHHCAQPRVDAGGNVQSSAELQRGVARSDDIGTKLGLAPYRTLRAGWKGEYPEQEGREAQRRSSGRPYTQRSRSFR